MKVTLHVWNIMTDILIHRETHINTVRTHLTVVAVAISVLQRIQPNRNVYLFTRSTKQNKTNTFPAFTGQAHERNNYKSDH